jgi:hypothetical protein
MTETNTITVINNHRNSPTVFSFKVISIGTFEQLLADEKTILNRPLVDVDGKAKRWGHEYLLYDKSFQKDLEGGCFLGSFGIDKRNKKNLKLFKFLGAPIRKPNYFVITLNHKGEKLHKDFDLIKSNPGSYSQIFSSAYHKLDGDDGVCDCQTIFIVQHGDIITFGDRRMRFCGKEQTFVDGGNVEEKPHVSVVSEIVSEKDSSQVLTENN